MKLKNEHIFVLNFKIFTMKKKRKEKILVKIEIIYDEFTIIYNRGKFW